MKKEEVRKLIEDYQKDLISKLEKVVDDKQSAADLDEGDTIDPEDFSHQTESGDMMRRMQLQLQEAENNLKELEEIDPERVDYVRLGAYIKTNHMNFLVGIPTKTIEHQGEKFMGISTEAPLYLKMLNKKKGDKFDFANLSYVINSVE